MPEYIEREKAAEMLENAQMITDGEYCGYCTEDVCLNNIPTADVVEVKHSAWGHKYSLHKIVCLNCGTPRPYQKTKRGYHLAWDSNYCPNCGAKMDLKEGAEE